MLYCSKNVHHSPQGDGILDAYNNTTEMVVESDVKLSDIKELML